MNHGSSLKSQRTMPGMSSHSGSISTLASRHRNGTHPTPSTHTPTSSSRDGKYRPGIFVIVLWIRRDLHRFVLELLVVGLDVVLRGFVGRYFNGWYGPCHHSRRAFGIGLVFPEANHLGRTSRSLFRFVAVVRRVRTWEVRLRMSAVTSLMMVVVVVVGIPLVASAPILRKRSSGSSRQHRHVKVRRMRWARSTTCHFVRIVRRCTSPGKFEYGMGHASS